MGKFKVVSDGELFRDTRIFDEEGRDISHRVRKVVITLEAGELPRMEVELIKPLVEVEIKPEAIDFSVMEREADEHGAVDVTPITEQYKVYELGE